LPDAAFDPTPFFLDGLAGPLFCLHFPAATGGRAARAILVLPPFAEELNKCRRMLALGARALQRTGRDVLLVDLYGTGDSAGDFADASLAVWRADLACAASWLAARGAVHLDILGVRAGALLLHEIELPPGMKRGRVALWQPVLSGRLLASQMLRLRLAEGMADGRSKPLGSRDVRTMLRNDGRIEVAGYELTEKLVSTLEELSDPLADAQHWERLTMFEVVSEGVTEMSAVSRRAMDALRVRGAVIGTEIVSGEPFWATPEIAIVPALLDATVAALAGAAG
jgi:exosortase A-associated hydrolase 2